MSFQKEFLFGVHELNMQSRDYLVVDSVQALFDAMRKGKKAIFNQIRVDGETQEDFVTRITGIRLEDGSYKSFVLTNQHGQELYWHSSWARIGAGFEGLDDEETEPNPFDEDPEKTHILGGVIAGTHNEAVCHSDCECRNSEAFKEKWQNIKGTI